MAPDFVGIIPSSQQSTSQPTKLTTFESFLYTIISTTILAAPEPALVAASLPAQQPVSQPNLQPTMLAVTKPAHCTAILASI